MERICDFQQNQLGLGPCRSMATQVLLQKYNGGFHLRSTFKKFIGLGPGAYTSQAFGLKLHVINWGEYFYSPL